MQALENTRTVYKGIEIWLVPWATRFGEKRLWDYALYDVWRQMDLGFAGIAANFDEALDDARQTIERLASNP